MVYFKKYYKYLIAIVVGVGLALTSWVFVIEPSFPYLLLDVECPVIDDITGLGYLPVEMTGGRVDTAIVKHMCVVPEVYAEYMHNVPDKDNVMSAESDVGKFILKWSWAIVAAPLVMLFGYLVYKKKRSKNI